MSKHVCVCVCVCVCDMCVFVCVLDQLHRAEEMRRNSIWSTPVCLSLCREEPRALHTHRHTQTHTSTDQCTVRILYEQIDYACRSQLRSLDLLMHAPRQFYVCVRFMREGEGERERQREREIKRVTYIKCNRKGITGTGERGRLLTESRQERQMRWMESR